MIECNPNELKRCPACNKEISVFVLNCPVCGRPKPFKLVRLQSRGKVKCNDCEGTGFYEGVRRKCDFTCPVCNGSGEIISDITTITCEINNDIFGDS